MVVPLVVSSHTTEHTRGLAVYQVVVPSRQSYHRRELRLVQVMEDVVGTIYLIVI